MKAGVVTPGRKDSARLVEMAGFIPVTWPLWMRKDTSILSTGKKKL